MIVVHAGIMVRNGAPSSANRHTVALGKGGGFAQSNNIPPPLPVLHTQDDINTSPRTDHIPPHIPVPPPHSSYIPCLLL